MGVITNVDEETVQMCFRSTNDFKRMLYNVSSYTLTKLGGGLAKMTVNTVKTASKKVSGKNKHELSENQFMKKYQDSRVETIEQRNFDEDKKITDLIEIKDIKKELDKNKVDYLFRVDSEGYFSITFATKHEEKFKLSLNNLSSLMRKREKDRSEKLHDKLKNRAENIKRSESSLGKDKNRKQELER